MFTILLKLISNGSISRKREEENMGYQETKVGKNKEERSQGQTVNTALCVFNEKDFLDNIGGDRVLMGYLVSVFIDDFGTWKELFEKALARRDAVLLRQLAHKMKGSALNVRAEVIAKLLGDIEEKASKEDLSWIRSMFDALCVEFKRFENVFTTIRQA